MKATRLLVAASIAGVVAATAMSASALAWHPKGAIKKFVQNQTAASALSDANDASNAVAAKPGDILKYVIEIRNDGEADNSNSMHFSRLTDTLPAGLQLVSDPQKREITEDLGVIKPGEKVTKEYLVKVISTKDGDIIENKACFTGDSEVKDQPQQGCDVADVKIVVPKETPKPEQPKPEASKPTQTQPQVLSSTTQLPKTGTESFIAPLAAFTSGAAAYAGRLIVVKRRQK